MALSDPVIKYPQGLRWEGVCDKFQLLFKQETFLISPLMQHLLTWQRMKEKIKNQKVNIYHKGKDGNRIGGSHNLSKPKCIKVITMKVSPKRYFDFK